MISSITVLCFTNPQTIIETMTSQASLTVDLCINLIAVYIVWMGILEILEQTGLSQKLSNLLSPIIKKLFRITDNEQVKYISLNLSSNILGLGNAATPSGIKAMQSLQKTNKTALATFPMLLLVIINSTSIQLFPTTAIGLRASAGSLQADDILFPTLFATIISCVISVLIFIIYHKIARRNKPL